MTPFRLRNYLRSETRALHHKVDHAFSRFALDDDVQLEHFLVAQAGALRPLEATLEAGDRGGIAALLPDWPARRRAPLLAGLGPNVPDLRIAPLRTDAERLGVAYVLEGSRLGGGILLDRIRSRHSAVARLGIGFLSHDPGASHWQTFVAALDRLGGEQTRAESLAGAVTAFQLFERAANAVHAAK